MAKYIKEYPNSDPKKYVEEDSNKRAKFLHESEALEAMHSVFASQGEQSTINSEAKCHYVTYVLGSKGHIIEMDGRRPRPVIKGECDDQMTFHLKVAEIIKGYIEASQKEQAEL